jgi:single-strand DNA-binding protein
MMVLSGVGRLGKDAETRYTQGGMAVTTFSVACSEKSKGVESTTWVECVIFGDRGVAVAPYILKGDRFGFTGQGKLDSWEGRDGATRQTLKCNVNDFELMGQPKAQDQEARKPPGKVAAKPAAGGFDDFQDDIPFSNYEYRTFA